ncbi:MAG: hypothetical protein ACW97X_14990 [Candidatus Hodarchaeales archaeon]|jgi:hypothetical protein
MKDKFRVIPKRIARSRKIQVRQFEPEEIYIEYELDIQDQDDPSIASKAIQEATRLAEVYLDNEETKLRSKMSDNGSIGEDKQNMRVSAEYGLEITEEVKSLGDFRIKPSDDPQFANFIHLWLEKDQKETYIGYLLKNTGDFKFKKKNKDFIKQHGIGKGKHFRIIKV